MEDNKKDLVYISVREACRKYGYTRGYIYFLVKRNAINFIRNKNSLLVSDEDLSVRAEQNRGRIKKLKKKNKEVKQIKVEKKEFNKDLVIQFLVAVVGVFLGYLIANLLK